MSNEAAMGPEPGAMQREDPVEDMTVAATELEAYLYYADNGADERGGDPISSLYWVAAATFVGAAIASGVIGNIAFEAVKSAFQRARANLADGPYTASSNQELELLAKLAVQARCGELDLPVPRYEDLYIGHYSTVLASGHHDACFLAEVVGSNILATVLIPYGELDGKRLEVTVRTWG